MELSQILPHIERIRGCTFASLDATTEPSPGIKIVTTGLRVLLFSSTFSGYEAMVRRRLEEAGKDPLSFSVGPLPWGEHVGNLPIIEYRGKHYLQSIPLSPGKVVAMIGATEVDVETLRSRLRLNSNDPSQGLPTDRQVKVRCYLLDNIDSVRLLGEEVVSA